MRKYLRLLIIFVGSISLLCLSDNVSAQARQTLPGSDSLQVLVNKVRPLSPVDYTPNDLVVPQAALASTYFDQEMQLRKPAAEAVSKLFYAADTDGIHLLLSSGYRSYADQFDLYRQAIAQQGEIAIDEVAMPGTSEHQTGLAADVILNNYMCAAQGCFTITKAASWLQDNSYRYGLIVRYPKYKETITGYTYEPWHVRYVGTSLATKLHDSGLTLEEYYLDPR